MQNLNSFFFFFFYQRMLIGDLFPLCSVYFPPQSLCFVEKPPIFKCFSPSLRISAISHSHDFLLTCGFKWLNVAQQRFLLFWKSVFFKVLESYSTVQFGFRLTGSGSQVQRSHSSSPIDICPWVAIILIPSDDDKHWLVCELYTWMSANWLVYSLWMKKLSNNSLSHSLWEPFYRHKCECCVPFEEGWNLRIMGILPSPICSLFARKKQSRSCLTWGCVSQLNSKHKKHCFSCLDHFTSTMDNKRSWNFIHQHFS